MSSFFCDTLVSFALEIAAGRKKDVLDIGVHGEIQQIVGTSVVMRHFCILPGALRVRHEITGTPVQLAETILERAKERRALIPGVWKR